MAADDEVTVVVYDIFTVADMVSATSGGTFNGGDTVGSTLDVTGNVSFNGGSFVFNEDSADVDFRIESNDSANMFVVDGGNNLVTLQNDSDTDYNTNQTASNTVLNLKETTDLVQAIL